MPKQNPNDSISMSFRLPKADREWLESTARANGVEVAQILRWALEAYRQYIQAHDGKIHLPINIKEFWQLAQVTKPQPTLRVADEPSDSQEEQTRRTDVRFEPGKKAKG